MVGGRYIFGAVLIALGIVMLSAVNARADEELPDYCTEYECVYPGIPLNLAPYQWNEVVIEEYDDIANSAVANICMTEFMWRDAEGITYYYDVTGRNINTYPFDFFIKGQTYWIYCGSAVSTPDLPASAISRYTGLSSGWNLITGNGIPVDLLLDSNPNIRAVIRLSNTGNITGAMFPNVTVPIDWRFDILVVGDVYWILSK